MIHALFGSFLDVRLYFLVLHEVRKNVAEVMFGSTVCDLRCPSEPDSGVVDWDLWNRIDPSLYLCRKTRWGPKVVTTIFLSDMLLRC